MKITKDQLYKMIRKARRDAEIESGIKKQASGYHKSKKDKKTNNTIRLHNKREADFIIR